MGDTATKRGWRDWFRRAETVVDRPTITASVRPGPGRTRLDSPAVLARYEAGQTWSRNRSWLQAYVQDARQDISPGERIEMVRKSRYFERNNATMQKILDLIEVNVVGTGIHATPSADDPDAEKWTPDKLEEWNRKALARWTEWCKYADLTSRQSFESLQALIVRAQAVDGEIFVWLTYGDPDQQGNQFPRIQLIEGHRVTDAKLPANWEREGYTLFDGILFDARGRPAFYVVANDFDAFTTDKRGTVAIIPAEQIVHVYEPSRTSQPRGIPLFHSCLHDLHDLDDLQQYEMLASKDAASRANIIKTASGEIADQDGRIIGETEEVTDSNGQIQERITYYNSTIPGNTVVLKHGDDFEQSTALRPTAAQQEFWRELMRKVCRGVGISYAAVVDYEGGWSGPALRGALTADNRFYDVRTHTVTSAFDRIYEHVIAQDVKPGGALFPAPRNWKKVTWQSPRRSTIDIGRESAAILNELRVGLRTFRDVCGETGLDWRDVLTQRLAEQAFILKTAKKLKLPAGVVLAMLGAAPNTNVFGEKAAEAIDGPKPDAGISDPDTEERSGPGDEDEEEEIDIDEVRT